jgi:ribosomal protein S21
MSSSKGSMCPRGFASVGLSAETVCEGGRGAVGAVGGRIACPAARRGLMGFSRSIRYAGRYCQPSNSIHRRSVSRTRRLEMRVIVREGEKLSDALWRFNRLTRLAHRRQWYKTRPGAYEKPSQRRRKSESRRARNARRHGRPGIITIYIGLGGLFSREEPFPWKRKPFRSHRRWWGDSD